MAKGRWIIVAFLATLTLCTFVAGRWGMGLWLSNENYRRENVRLQSKLEQMRESTSQPPSINLALPAPAGSPDSMSQRRSSPRRKNVLLIVADDLRPQLGFLGREDAHTPNLDALAAESMVFTRAYCQAPQCNPSRSSFLTGYSPDVARVFAFEATARENMGPRASATIFDRMRSHGHLVLGTGKIFHFDPPHGTFSPENGQFFPVSYDQEYGCSDKEPTGLCKPVECRRGGCPNAKVYLEAEGPGPSQIFDARVAAEALRKLDQAGAAWRANGTNSFVAVGFHHPHLKWFVPRELWSDSALWPAMKAVKPPLHNRPPLGAPFFAHGDVSIAGEAQLVNGGRGRINEPGLSRPVDGSEATLIIPQSAPSHEVLVEMRRAYVACVSFLDQQVGKVLTGLRAQGAGFDKNTVVIFTSDHGFGLGEGGHWGKSSLYEVDTRVPLIVRDPSLPQSRGKQSDLLVELVDLYPSIIELSGLPYYDILRNSFEGRSVKAVLQSPRLSQRDWGRSIAVSMIAKCGGAGMRTGRNPPFLCKQRSNGWFESHGHGWPSNGPPPLVGFAARSKFWRYVAWMPHNRTLDAVDWSVPPFAQELFYYGADERRGSPPSFDHWDRENLLRTAESPEDAPKGVLKSFYRRVAEIHQGILVEVSKRRRGLLGKYAWGVFDEMLQPKQRLLNNRAEPPAFGGGMLYGPDIPNRPQSSIASRTTPRVRWSGP